MPRGSETRTLPSDSTPIARSTWLGVSVLDVHDEPDDTEKPALSSAWSRASPSAYRQEKVTTFGRRRTGIAYDLDVRDQFLNLRPVAVDQRAQPPRLLQPRLRLGPYGAQGSRCGDDGRDVLEAGGAALFALADGRRCGEAHPFAYGQQADAGRAAPLVGAAGQQRPTALADAGPR